MVTFAFKKNYYFIKVVLKETAKNNFIVIDYYIMFNHLRNFKVLILDSYD